jgi:hypothetical protein
MGSTPGYSQRRERSDTKTLIRLGTERGSDPVALSPEQHELVSEIARGDAGESRVQLWFHGLPEPVRARLRVQGGRIQLEAALPFLEIDSKVGVARVEGNAARLEGRIARVSLVTSADQPVPRLCVDLALPGENANATSAGAPASSVLRQHITDATSTPPISITTAPVARSRSVLPWTLAFVLGLAGGAVGSWGWLAEWLEHPFELLSQRTQASGAMRQEMSRALVIGADFAPAAEPSSEVLETLLAFHADEGEANPLALDLPEPLALVTPVDPLAGPFMLEREPSALRDDALIERGTAPALRDDALIERGTAPALRGGASIEQGDYEAGAELEADVREPSPVAKLAQGLEIKATDKLTEIVVPMQGSAEGLARYVLTTPGIALTLPNARALVPLENYAARRPLVRRVWLRPHETGVQVRIIYPNASVRDEIRFDDRGLHVLLRR